MRLPHPFGRLRTGSNLPPRGKGLFWDRLRADKLRQGEGTVGTGSYVGPAGSTSFLGDDSDVQLIELRLLDLGGGLEQRVEAALRLGEGDDVADVVAPA